MPRVLRQVVENEARQLMRCIDGELAGTATVVGIRGSKLHKPLKIRGGFLIIKYLPITLLLVEKYDYQHLTFVARHL